MDLFTHEQEYRTEKLLTKMAAVRIMFAGCGAIGSNLIDNMARQGFKTLSTVDKDRVEDHNKGTQIWDRLDVGGLKTERMKTKIYNSTGTILNSLPKELSENNIGKILKKPNFEIVIDSFDESKSRGLLYNYCKENQLDCLHVGLFKDYAEVIWNEFYTVPGEPKGLDVCEYPLARNVILLSVAVASETIIKYLNDGTKKNYFITLKDLKINEFHV
jgi:molybdopterin/thiamine biosynthesis adenylyltransferase